MLRLVKCVMITPLLTSRREIAPSPRRPQGALEFFSCTRHILHLPMQGWGFPHGSVGKESTGNAGDAGRRGFNSQVRKIPWRRAWQPTPVFSPGESHGQSSLLGYSPWGHKESNATERLTRGGGKKMWLHNLADTFFFMKSRARASLFPSSHLKNSSHFPG